MADYISREAAADCLTRLANTLDEQIGYSSQMADAIQDILLDAATEIRAIPAADVEPVRHGVWKERVECIKYGPFTRKKTRMVCSCCGNYNGNWMIKFNYCFNCGAKMDLEDDNGT